MSFTESSHIDAKNRSKNDYIHLKKEDFHHVMCFGTFDLFHPGHKYYISEASKLASHMTIVIARDARVAHGKGRTSIHKEGERLESVKTAFPTARVILGDEHDIFAPIRTLEPDILAFGYDQRVPEEKLHELFPHISITRIGGYETDRWKSSILRDKETKPKDKA